MHIQLIQGRFTAKEAMDMITEMIHVKVRYHESKITSTSNEEDIKHRETKIKRLQQELFETTKALSTRSKGINIDAVISMEEAQP